mmetsp:Transcript_35626/g.93160  ORF Transcript_35626/g.93160 Transcript_35626/m.93160 type:complete len:830 (+) Transcript_35626:33-2522(+)
MGDAEEDDEHGEGVHKKHVEAPLLPLGGFLNLLEPVRKRTLQWSLCRFLAIIGLFLFSAHGVRNVPHQHMVQEGIYQYLDSEFHTQDMLHPRRFSKLSLLSEVWTWVHAVLAPGVWSLDPVAPAYLPPQSGANRAIGPVRLRQHRVTPTTCESVSVCWEALGTGTEDIALLQDRYSWTNETHPVEKHSSWTERAHVALTVQDLLGAHGNGLVVDIAACTTSSRWPAGQCAEMAELQQAGWLDEGTRSLIVSVPLFNGHLDMLVLVEAIVLANPSGRVQGYLRMTAVPARYYEGTVGKLRFATEAVFLFLVVADLFIEAASIRRYFRALHLLNFLTHFLFLAAGATWIWFQQADVNALLKVHTQYPNMENILFRYRVASSTASAALAWGSLQLVCRCRCFSSVELLQRAIGRQSGAMVSAVGFYVVILVALAVASLWGFRENLGGVQSIAARVLAVTAGGRNPLSSQESATSLYSCAFLVAYALVLAIAAAVIPALLADGVGRSRRESLVCQEWQRQHLHYAAVLPLFCSAFRSEVTQHRLYALEDPDVRHRHKEVIGTVGRSDPRVVRGVVETAVRDAHSGEGPRIPVATLVEAICAKDHHKAQEFQAAAEELRGAFFENRDIIEALEVFQKKPGSAEFVGAEEVDSAKSTMQDLTLHIGRLATDIVAMARTEAHHHHVHAPLRPRASEQSLHVEQPASQPGPVSHPGKDGQPQAVEDRPGEHPGPREDKTKEAGGHAGIVSGPSGMDQHMSMSIGGSTRATPRDFHASMGSTRITPTDQRISGAAISSRTTPKDQLVSGASSRAAARDRDAEPALGAGVGLFGDTSFS